MESLSNVGRYPIIEPQFITNPAEVPGIDVILSDIEFSDHMFSEKPTNSLVCNDPLMGSNNKYDPAGSLYSDQRLDLESTSSAIHPSFHSNNFWLTPQASNQPSVMAFQPVSMSNQLPSVVGAEYQIQSGMDTIASPYSPESDGSFDDQVDAPFQLRFPPGFEVKEPIQKLTEEQLVSLSARDLNTICRDLPEDVVKQLKKRRRTLKNRGYAYNSRVRRVSQKNQLEKERDELQKQIAQLQDKVRHLEKEADAWKRKAQSIERGELSHRV
jgi:polyhydroxyalkanoate synthesis regulator phasin